MGGKGKQCFLCCLFVAYLFLMSSASNARKSNTRGKFQALENLLRSEVYFLHEKIDSQAKEREHFMQRMNETLDYIDDLAGNIKATMQVDRHKKQGSSILETCPVKIEQVNVTIEKLQETVERTRIWISEEKKVRKTDKDAVFSQMKRIEEQQNETTNDISELQTRIEEQQNETTNDISELQTKVVRLSELLENELERQSHARNIRLRDGTRDSQGRLEVYYNNTWGTVCADKFDSNAAAVVCRMLGYTGNLFFAQGSVFHGAGTGQIWLDDVSCNGDETSLFNCRMKPWGIHNCRHYEDVGVDCQPTHATNVRLRDGTRDSQGRLEVFHNNTWGTVCYDEFDSNAAAVVCRMLGYTGNLFFAQGSVFHGAGTGQIWLDDVSCNGDETSLFNCRMKPWGIHNCRHDKDVGVDCQPTHATNVRLRDGTRDSQGRLEVFHNNTWGTVCYDEFDSNAAAVVCRMLGYTGNLFLAQGTVFHGAGIGQIWLGDVSCNGKETSLFNCRMNPWGQNNCGHDEDVGVDCQPNLDGNIPIRLVGGTNNREGRVEIQFNGQWGRICDDGWDDKAAQVTCKQLNIPTAVAVPLNNAVFGNGVGPVWLSDVKCTGREADLGACVHKPLDMSTCLHRKDAGVMCIAQSAGTPHVQVRLTGGLTMYEGRVEINLYDHWGTICEDSFDDRDATVICRMLGHHRGGHRLQRMTFGPGSGQIWLDDLDCNGTESSILNCVHKGLGINNCGHYKDVAIQCMSDDLN